MGGATLIVLDTHAVIWYAGGVKLRGAAQMEVDTAVTGDGAMLSAISAWEIGTLVRRGRLIPPVAVEEYVFQLFRGEGIIEAPVSAEIAELAARLGDDFHGDPADRIIVATAALLQVPLVTRDKQIVTYLRKTKAAAVIAC